MIIINRIFISTNIEIRKIATSIFIRDLKSKIHYFDEYAVFIFYMKRVLLENKRTFAKIIREIHIINNLKTKIFVETNIFILKQIIIDFVNQSIFINSCRNLIVFMNSRTRSEFIKRTIKTLSRIIVPSRITIQIPITYFGKLFKNRDIFFESQYSLFLKHVEGVYIHIIDTFFRAI